jgi:hypothetical protein
VDSDSHRSGSFPSWDDDNRDGLSAWLVQLSIPSADGRGTTPGFPAGPGLSAVDMAAACLCLADAVWNVDAIRSVGVNPGAAGSSSS